VARPSAPAYGGRVALRLTPVVEGNETGQTIVFIQGWPDDASLWDGAVAALRGRYRCVRTTLPNYGGDRTERWGYTTAEILEAIEMLIRDAGGGNPVTLVLHDWGCYWGHAVHHRCPNLVARIAGVDVAPHYKPSPRAVLGIIAYQWWLLAAFLVDGQFGNWMTRSFAKVARVPAEPERLSSWMNYPYRNVWADLLVGRDRKLTRGYWPTCPMLFVYGEKKLFPFHSEAWIDHVRSVGGEVVGLPCGHWVPLEPSFVAILDRWLNDHPVVTAKTTSSVLN
jgi:pimeloyl-ACP methyl ester carboxylesterase